MNEMMMHPSAEVFGRIRNPVHLLEEHVNGVLNDENKHANTVFEQDFHSPQNVQKNLVL